MGDLHLTEEERKLAEDMAGDRNGFGARVGFYGSVLVPFVLFASYGILKSDVVAIGLAFVGLLLFVCWGILREFGHLPRYKSLFQKVAEHERHSAE